MGKLEKASGDVVSNLVKAASAKGTYNNLASKESKGYILIVGPQGVGKTIGMLRASKYFPHERLKMTRAQLFDQPLIFLPDICHVAIDPGAQTSAMSIRVKSDAKNIWPIVDTFQKGFVDVVKNFEEILEDFITPEHTMLALDTATTMDDELVTFCKTNAKESKSGFIDTSAMWTQLQAYHNQARVAANKVAVRHNLDLVIITHAKVDSPGIQDKEVASAKREAYGRDKAISIDMSLTGKAGEHYKNAADLILAAKKEYEGSGANKEEVRKFYTEHDDWNLKSRMALAIGHEFDMNLGEVLTKWKNWKEGIK